MRAEIVFLTITCAAVAGDRPVRSQEPARAAPHRCLGEGREGLVVGLSGKQSVHAGAEILKQGGSAADAAMATAMSQIVEAAGSYVSFAGILSMVYYDASAHQYHYLNAGYNTPIDETDALSIPKADVAAGTGVPSGRTALVPGFMAGVQAAHERFGKLPLARLFAPAIALAEEGIDIDPVFAAFIQYRRDVLGRLPETRRVFTRPDGAFYRRGDRFRQTELAATLRRVAEQGAGGDVQRRVGAPLRRRRTARRREDHPRRPEGLPCHVGGADRDELPRRPGRRRASRHGAESISSRRCKWRSSPVWSSLADRLEVPKASSG